MLLYAPELRLGSGLNPLPFFMYPSFFAAVIKFIFGMVFFCVVGIVLVRLSVINIFIATYDLGLTDLTQLGDLASLNFFKSWVGLSWVELVVVIRRSILPK